MVKTENEHTIKTAKFEATLLAENLLYLHYFYNQEIDVAEVRKGFEFHDEIGADENVKRLVHCEKFVSITKDARELVEQHGRPAKAEAYVIPFLPQKILFNLYSKFRKRKHPLKSFNTIDEALEWLNSFD